MLYRLSAAILLLLVWPISQTSASQKRSIDLIAAYGLISNAKIPRHILPNNYELEIQPYPEKGNFRGRIRINATWHEETNKITLHAHEDLKISAADVKVSQLVPDDETSLKRNLARYSPPLSIKVLETERDKDEPFFIITLEKALKRGSQCEIELSFSGRIYNETTEGLFRTSYIDQKTGETKWVVATHFRPNLARRVFPCFDEPAYKATFVIIICRRRNMVTASNMPLESSKETVGDTDAWFWDRFYKTPPMSTFTVGFVICEFEYDAFTVMSDDKSKEIDIRVWARPAFLPALQNVTEKVAASLNIQEDFWGTAYPLPKLDIFALPNYQATRPADNWGLILFRESDLTGQGSWHISQEIAYQWLGAYATPYWWSDAHTNHALVRYVTAYTTLEMYNGLETFNNWPMTMLYSIYYEFSKRYPHGKSTAIKQDSTSAKTELVFRMLNYTLGENVFKRGIRKFIRDRQFKTFFGDDLWRSISEAAWLANIFNESIRVTDIAASWITKDRLPVVNVTRNYESWTATLTQRVYLRERPHDVPDKEKFLWWIPIVLVKGNRLDFSNSKPITWMAKEREIKISRMPDENTFIIVNPEEIGPFPVNYDVRNWNMLASFLNSENRTQIPVNTRAKLLHDAWNLAYAGDLGFGTALNMTLFLAHEREYLAWDAVFTMIDHIGRHIDSSEVYKKFQTYVRLLLTPLYKELGNDPQEGESDGRAHLRSTSKVFLCQSGYSPCIQEAQEAFKKWMESEDPDEGNPVANQYICTVFKWGSKEEWEFGLERVIRFPENRQQNERTYLLKTLAGCPVDSWKIERLLNITVLEENGNFTDNDVYLIFSMLTGGANGYTTLFNFLERNWDAIKVRFQDKPSLWNSLLTSATTVFKTQEGLDKVSKLYVSKQGNFGTGEFIVERAIKIIKEETKWSNENLPVIEKWLDNYLKDKQTI